MGPPQNPVLLNLKVNALTNQINNKKGVHRTSTGLFTPHLMQQSPLLSLIHPHLSKSVLHRAKSSSSAPAMQKPLTYAARKLHALASRKFF